MSVSKRSHALSVCSYGIGVPPWKRHSRYSAVELENDGADAPARRLLGLADRDRDALQRHRVGGQAQRDVAFPSELCHRVERAPHHDRQARLDLLEKPALGVKVLHPLEVA